MGKTYKKSKKLKNQAAQKLSIWKKRLPMLVFIYAFLLYSNTVKHNYALDDYPAIAHNQVISRGLDKVTEILTQSFYHGSAGSEHACHDDKVLHG